MKRPAFGSALPHLRLRILLGLGAWAACGTGVIAQSPPPVVGTIALEGTMQKFYRAANVIVVKTLDGVEHVGRRTVEPALSVRDRRWLPAPSTSWLR